MGLNNKDIKDAYNEDIRQVISEAQNAMTTFVNEYINNDYEKYLTNKILNIIIHDPSINSKDEFLIKSKNQVPRMVSKVEFLKCTNMELDCFLFGVWNYIISHYESIYAECNSSSKTKEENDEDDCTIVDIHERRSISDMVLDYINKELPYRNSIEVYNMLNESYRFYEMRFDDIINNPIPFENDGFQYIGPIYLNLEPKNVHSMNKWCIYVLNTEVLFQASDDSKKVHDEVEVAFSLDGIKLVDKIQRTSAEIFSNELVKLTGPSYYQCTVWFNYKDDVDENTKRIKCILIKCIQLTEERSRNEMILKCFNEIYDNL